MGLKQIGLKAMGILSMGRIKANRQIVPSPLPLSAQVDSGAPTDVEITFDEALNPASTPAITAFVLTGKTISNVSIIGAVVTLTVTVAYVFGDVITVDYIKPVSNPLRSLSTNQRVGSFIGQVVTNNVPDPYGPELVDQANWYKQAYWNTWPAEISTVGTTIVFTGAVNVLQKWGGSPLVVGTTYKLTYTLSVALGHLSLGDNNNGWDDQYNSGTYTVFAVCANGIMLIGPATFTGVLSAFSIKEVL